MKKETDALVIRVDKVGSQIKPNHPRAVITLCIFFAVLWAIAIAPAWLVGSVSEIPADGEKEHLTERPRQLQPEAAGPASKRARSPSSCWRPLRRRHHRLRREHHDEDPDRRRRLGHRRLSRPQALQQHRDDPRPLPHPRGVSLGRLLLLAYLHHAGLHDLLSFSCAIVLYLAELYGFVVYILSIFVNIDPLDRKPIPLKKDAPAALPSST